MCGMMICDAKSRWLMVDAAVFFVDAGGCEEFTGW